jgi:hypothetical protein
MSKESPIADPQDYTVSDLLEMASNYEAGVMKVIARNQDGSIKGSVIVTNAESTEEIVAAVEEIEDKWSDEDDDDDEPPVADATPPTPVPVRIKGVGAKGATFLLGMMQIHEMDASIVFGAHDALELTFDQDQMKRIMSIFHEHLHGHE